MVDVKLLNELYFETEYMKLLHIFLMIMWCILLLLSIFTKGKVIISNCISAYYGVWAGSMLGYFMEKSLTGMKIGGVIGIIIVLLINNILGRKHILVVAYMFYMQCAYMCTYMILYLFRIDYYVDMLMGRDILLYEENHYSAMNMSLIISCVFAVIMTVRMERTQRDRNIIHMYYIFVSAVMALCGLLSGPDWVYGYIGSWQDFFLPLLGVEYGIEVVTVGLLLLVLLCIGCGLHTWTKNKNSDN